MRTLLENEIRYVNGGLDAPAPNSTVLPPAISIRPGISENEAQLLNAWISAGGIVDDLSDYNVVGAASQWDDITGQSGVISSYVHSMYSDAMKNYCMSNGYGYQSSTSTPGVCIVNP